MRYFAISSLIVLLIAPPCHSSTPEKVVIAYFQQIKTGGMGTIAGLMHPNELAKFRRMFQPIVEGGLASNEAPAFRQFADPKQPQKMRPLSDEEFMNVFMNFVDAQQPELKKIVKAANIQTIGHVTEGDAKHVIVRMKMNYQGLEIEKLAVISVKDHLGQPRMMLTAEMKGIADALATRSRSQPRR